MISIRVHGYVFIIGCTLILIGLMFHTIEICRIGFVILIPQALYTFYKIVIEGE